MRYSRLAAPLVVCIALLSWSPATCAVVDLNRASQAELESLPGIGPKKAEAIMVWRRQHGGFRRIEDLQRVPGFGPKTVNNLRGVLVVGTPPVAKKPAGR